MADNRRQRATERLRDSLLEALEEFFDAYLEEDVAHPDGAGLSEHRTRLATAVLIVEITRADFEITQDERDAMLEAAQHALQLSPEETQALVRSAYVQAERAPRLQEYAAVVDRCCTPDQKKRIVEALWRVAFSDAELLAHEEYLVRKISELLHVPRKDFLEAKINAREEFR